MKAICCFACLAVGLVVGFLLGLFVAVTTDSRSPVEIEIASGGGQYELSNIDIDFDHKVSVRLTRENESRFIYIPIADLDSIGELVTEIEELLSPKTEN